MVNVSEYVELLVLHTGKERKDRNDFFLIRFEAENMGRLQVTTQEHIDTLHNVILFGVIWVLLRGDF